MGSVGSSSTSSSCNAPSLRSPSPSSSSSLSPSSSHSARCSFLDALPPWPLALGAAGEESGAPEAAFVRFRADPLAAGGSASSPDTSEATEPARVRRVDGREGVGFWAAASFFVTGFSEAQEATEPASEPASETTELARPRRVEALRKVLEGAASEADTSERAELARERRGRVGVGAGALSVSSASSASDMAASSRATKSFLRPFVSRPRFVSCSFSSETFILEAMGANTL
mmetsp:Transcript_26612/g.59546  ORF Transcript_26612/g.59546 Transcript_26612/m.59546 type:complete len:231 (-) Transcript_26612:13-705(-)